jgi:hypothetical protein
MSVNMNVRISARDGSDSARCRLGGLRLHVCGARDVEDRAEALERSAGRRKLERRGLRITAGAIDGGEHHSRARRLVRRVQLLPAATARAKRPLRGRLVAGRELQAPARAQRGRLEGGCGVHGGDGVELVGGGARGRMIAGGDRDLHLRGQQVAPCEPIARIVSERAADRRARGIDLLLGEAEEREAGLRIASELVRLPERLFGFPEIAEAEANLAELVERLAGGADGVGPQLLTGVGRLARRVCERAAQPHDTGPVHATDAGEAEDALPLAPLVRGVGPLAGPPVVGEPPAHVDRVAIDDAGRVRAEVTAYRDHRGLLEQSQALGHLAFRDQKSPELLKLQRGEIAIVEARREVMRGSRVRERLVEILRDKATRPQQVAILDRVPLRLEQALGAPHPSARQRALPLREVIVGEKDRHESGAPPVAPLEIRRVSTLTRSDGIVEPADPVGGVCQAFEVCGFEPLDRCGRAELLEGLVPCVTPQRVPPGRHAIVDVILHRLHARSLVRPERNVARRWNRTDGGIGLYSDYI